MSEAHKEHQSAIRTPKQLIVAVAAGFIVPIIIIVLLVQYVTNANKSGAGSQSQTAEAIAARIKPVADEGFTLKDVNAPKQLLAAEAVYKSTCAACHATGAAGAPKVGDAGAWSSHLSQGYDSLLTHALNGIRAMPARGGNPDLDDVEVARALVYMANQSGAKFKEPEVKAAAAAPAASAVATATASASAPAVVAVAATSAAAPAPAPLAVDAGKKTYEATCQACHATGAAGAPKYGDKAAWANRVKQGLATLQAHALKGFNAMPAKGGSSASDDEVKAAVEYMAAAAK